METYEYGRIRLLAQSLAAANLPEEIIAKIMAGGEAISKSARPEVKAAWLAEAMRRMDRLLKPAVRHAVRERCACCIGGKRLQLSKAIARDHDTLEDRVAAANATPFVFGHSVRLLENGEVLVAFSPEGQGKYRCVCLSKAAEPVSITYCYCCGGHVKHHLQTALGTNLQMKVASSALASGVKKSCTFRFKILD